MPIARSVYPPPTNEMALMTSHGIAVACHDKPMSGHAPAHAQPTFPLQHERLFADATGSPQTQCSGATRRAAFKRQTAEVLCSKLAAVQAAPLHRRGLVTDWYSFTLSFKGVLLEGLEVAFIALTFGANQRNVPLAAFAALSAVLVVAVAGITLRAPLTRVPENAMKFIVGVMLTSFGIFWGAEGAGARWPAGDAALLVLVPAVALFAVTLVAALRRAGSRAVSSKVADESPS